MQLRGAIAWLVLMAIWSFYPDIQRHTYQFSTVELSVKPQQTATSNPDQVVEAGDEPELRQQAGVFPGLAEALESALVEEKL